jgi:signal transduction histidine kinase
MDKLYQEVRRVPVPDQCPLGHDLNNKLSVILGHCDLLSEHWGKDELAMKHLRVIQEAARHIADRIARCPCQP